MLTNALAHNALPGVCLVPVLHTPRSFGSVQSMAVGLKELAEFVSEVAPTVSKYWTTAGERRLQVVCGGCCIVFVRACVIVLSMCDAAPAGWSGAAAPCIKMETWRTAECCCTLAVAAVSQQAECPGLMH
jgi:hypothetical protein